MTILVATDLSDNSRPALAAAAAWAYRRNHPLTVLHCLEPEDGFDWSDLFENSDDESEFQASAERRLESFVEASLSDRPTPDETNLEVRSTLPETGILEMADQTGAAMSVVGATGQGAVAEYLFGSTAEEVVRRSERPVLVVPPDGDPDSPDEVLAPVDFSTCSDASLERAVDLADREEATLHVLHAYTPPTRDPTQMSPTLRPKRIESLEQKRRQRLDATVDEIGVPDLRPETHFEFGAPADVIVEAADELDIDTTVMGTHGRRGFERFFLGSTATKVLRRMPSPVMTVRTRS